MNAHRFDRISRRFAERRMSRRQALATGAAGIAAGLTAGGSVVGQEATPEAGPAEPWDGEKVMYLFVQSFQSGSIAPADGQEGRYTVTLDHGLGQTIYFGDRPSRDVGASPTSQFLQSLGFTEDNPPNAALIVETEPGVTDIAVVELFNPSYDEATHTATYDVEVLADWEDSVELGFHEETADLAALAPEFGTAHLLIDDCADSSVSCYTGADAFPEFLGSYDNLPFCYNYAICMPCEPYGHDQPDQCSTLRHWGEKCAMEHSRCQEIRCYADFAGAIFMGC